MRAHRDDVRAVRACGLTTAQLGYLAAGGSPAAREVLAEALARAWGQRAQAEYLDTVARQLRAAKEI